MTPPVVPRTLGLLGLAPQIIAGYVLLENNAELHFAALCLAYAYATLILSFLGGLWWGLAARVPSPPGWIWYAAVTPSLIAFAGAVPWATAQPWPGPSLILIGGALIAALGIDWRLQRIGIAPDWWMSLRVPLSIGLGGMTLAIGLFVAPIGAVG